MSRCRGQRISTLQWGHNGRDGVSNHQPHHCLLNSSFRRRSKKTSELRVTGLYVGNSPVTSEFPTQMASNAENVSIWWRHHDWIPPLKTCDVKLFVSMMLAWARFLSQCMRIGYCVLAWYLLLTISSDSLRSLRHQDISSHDIDYMEYVGPFLTWGSVLSTSVKSMWRDDLKYKYMFMFPQKSFTRKGLIVTFYHVSQVPPYTRWNISSAYTPSLYHLNRFVQKCQTARFVDVSFRMTSSCFLYLT